MDKPSTSKAANGTETSDLAKSSLSNRDTQWGKFEELFLIKNDPIHVPKKNSYRILCYIDIVKVEGVCIYNSKLRYRDDFAYATGSVVAASTDVSFLHRLANKWEVEYPPNAFLLVQYRPTVNRLEHKVLHESNVVHITALSDKEAEHQDVFVRDGEKMCLACVLTCNVSKNRVMDELGKVKTKISASIGYTNMQPEDMDEDAATMPEGNPWFLIQYSADLMGYSHTIMRYEDTLHREINPYPCYQVIMENNGKLHHGLILYKSHNYPEVLFALHNIINSCVMSIYPQFKHMSSREKCVEKEILSVNEYGNLVDEKYVCCLESDKISESNN